MYQQLSSPDRGSHNPTTPSNIKEVQVCANYCDINAKTFFSAVLLLSPDERNFHSYENLITFISKGVIEFWCSPYEHHLYDLAGNQKPFDNPRDQTVLRGLIVLICSWNFIKVVVSSFPLPSFFQSQKPPGRTFVVFFFPRPVSETFSLIVEPLLLQPWITPFPPFWL